MKYISALVACLISSAAAAQNLGPTQRAPLGPDKDAVCKRIVQGFGFAALRGELIDLNPPSPGYGLRSTHIQVQIREVRNVKAVEVQVYKAFPDIPAMVACHAIITTGEGETVAGVFTNQGAGYRQAWTWQAD